MNRCGPLFHCSIIAQVRIFRAYYCRTRVNPLSGVETFQGIEEQALGVIHYGHGSRLTFHPGEDDRALAATCCGAFFLARFPLRCPEMHCAVSDR